MLGIEVAGRYLPTYLPGREDVNKLIVIRFIRVAVKVARLTMQTDLYLDISFLFFVLLGTEGKICYVSWFSCVNG